MFARLALLCVFIGGAAAAADDPLAKAQTHFRASKTLYDLGNFQDEIRESPPDACAGAGGLGCLDLRPR